MPNQYTSAFNKYGQAFGINPAVLSNIGRLESSYNPTIQNNYDINAQRGTPSYGLMQFIEPTFNDFYKQASAARPGIFRQLGAKDWKNPYQQIATTAWALANGKGSHWATYNRALSAAGGQLHGERRWDPSMPWSPGGSAPGVVKHQGNQRIIPGKWVGGPDQDRLRKAQVLANRSPGRAHLLGLWAEKHQRDNPYKWIPGKVVGKPTTYTQTGGVAGGAAGFGRNISDPQTLLRSLGKRFGLQWDSNAPWFQNHQLGAGQHAANSNHYKGTAADWGDARNSPEQLRALANWARQNADRIAEFYWNPMGWGIRDGQIIQGLSVAGHDDHLHLAF